MSQKKEPFFQGDAKDGKKVVARDHQELIDWLKEEQTFWSWLPDTFGEQIGLSEDRRRLLTNRLQSSWSHLNNADQSQWATAKQLITEHLASGLASTTPRAQFIVALRDEAGKVAASAAVAEFLGSVWSAQPHIHERHRYAVGKGRIAPHLFDAGIGAASGKSLKAASEKITAEFGQQIDKVIGDYEQIREHSKASVEAIEGQHVSWVAEKADEWKNFIDSATEKVRASVEQIENTEKAFKEDMRLKSSVAYWTEKGDGHSSKARLQIFLIAAYFFFAASLSAAAVWYVFQELITLLKGLEDRAAAPMFLLAGATLLLVSAVLWIAKLLVRVYFDERYRGQDAFERAKMAQTYVALTHENLVSPAERAIVLTSLFRSTNESGRTDDGGPETLHQALLARILDNKPRVN
jgi:hypothetical protein